MEVILLEKIKNLGALGARIRVKSGYARNFLIPRGKAAPATATQLAAFEAQRTNLEQAETEHLEKNRRRGDSIVALGMVVIRQRAGTEGRLFGSVGAIDIATAITDAGVSVVRSEVRLPNGPLRTVGDHEIQLHLHAEVNVSFTVSVMAED